MPNARLAVLALATTALALSACGKTSKTVATTASSKLSATQVTTAQAVGRPVPTGARLSRAQLLARANTICRGIVRKRASLKGTTAQALAEDAGALAAYEREAAAEMSRLAPPASLAGDWQTIVEGAWSTAAYTAKVQGYASSGRLQSPEAQLTISNNKVAEARVLAIARHDGFMGCHSIV